MVVNKTGSQQSRNRNTLSGGSAIRQNDDLVAVLDGVGSGLTDGIECLDVTRCTLALFECDVDGADSPVLVS